LIPNIPNRFRYNTELEKLKETKKDTELCDIVLPHQVCDNRVKKFEDEISEYETNLDSQYQQLNSQQKPIRQIGRVVYIRKTLPTSHLLRHSLGY